MTSLLLQFERGGWTDALKIEVLTRMLVEAGVPRATARQSAMPAAAAVDFADLCRLLPTLT